MAGVHGDQIGEVELAVQLFVGVVNLQSLITEVQLPLDSHELLHNLHYLLTSPLNLGSLMSVNIILMVNCFSCPGLGLLHLAGVIQV